MPAGHPARLAPPAAGSERGLSSGAAAYRRAEPYVAASSTLMGSVALFTALGYGLDRWLGHTVQWLLVTGAVLGLAVGFIGFFTRVLRADAAAKHLRSGAAVPTPAPASGGLGPGGRGGRGRRGTGEVMRDVVRVVHFGRTSGTGHAVPWCGVWGSMDTDWTAEGSGVTCAACREAMRDGARDALAGMPRGTARATR